MSTAALPAPPTAIAVVVAAFACGALAWRATHRPPTRHLHLSPAIATIEAEVIRPPAHVGGCFPPPWQTITVRPVRGGAPLEIAVQRRTEVGTRYVFWLMPEPLWRGLEWRAVAFSAPPAPRR